MQSEFSLRDRVVVITGGSRGIGEAIGLRLAREGAKIALWAKTVEPDPRLPGTMQSAAEAMRSAGAAEVLIAAVDLRFDAQVDAALEKVLEHFGGIDVLVNNASAISLSSTLDTPMKRFDLMFGVNVRATYLCSKSCLPALLRSDNPHILNLAPPLNLAPHHFAPHLAYTLSKYGMSMCTLGLAEEFRSAGVAVNALWPKTTIATAALRNVPGGDQLLRHSRKPEIVAEAAYRILRQNSRQCSGNFFLDEEVLRSAGVEDFDAYAVETGKPLQPDLFL